jgi:hypothetical protein
MLVDDKAVEEEAVRRLIERIKGRKKRELDILREEGEWT